MYPPGTFGLYVTFISELSMFVFSYPFCYPSLTRFLTHPSLDSLHTPLHCFSHSSSTTDFIIAHADRYKDWEPYKGTITIPKLPNSITQPYYPITLLPEPNIARSTIHNQCTLLTIHNQITLMIRRTYSLSKLINPNLLLFITDGDYYSMQAYLPSEQECMSGL